MIDDNRNGSLWVHLESKEKFTLALFPLTYQPYGVFPHKFCFHFNVMVCVCSDLVGAAAVLGDVCAFSSSKLASPSCFSACQDHMYIYIII